MRKGYDLLGLYHDADDPRIVVPKRMKALGWTVNVGHPKGQLALASVGMIILIVAGIQYG
ncbi:conserved hypothetical protein [Sphingomonas sp. T1]|uniref:DUF5808 domain-containing protein n=1 Tax=Sphingomonas sp. T1 TaxID=2653172 RepID=UPI000538696F|nr:hypothetical protein NI18_15150 [Sphingomonas sp. Ant20]VXD03727.1 conserved hypothetical protein [Sphingomonas sp. T1]